MFIPESMISVRNCIRNLFKTIIYVFLGCIASPVLLSIAILLFPAYIYRYIVTNHIAPRFRPGIAKAVTVTGQFLATELIPPNRTSEKEPATRCAIICTAVFRGTIKSEEAFEAISEGWFAVKSGESELRYPEFQQYIEKWMGFMFWKPDTNFSLDNHLHIHKILVHAPKEDSEIVLCSLVESLLNKRFPPKRSPWEIHLLQNFKNPNHHPSDSDESKNNDQLTTVVIFRFHHAMVDGFSIMYAIVEGLLGQKLPSIKIATPNKVVSSAKCCTCSSGILKKWIHIPWRVLYDLGYSVSVNWNNRGTKHTSTPWHVADSKKKWNQLYGRSQLISVDKVKFIKNQLGGSFTGVVLSCLAAGTAANFKARGYKGRGNFPVGVLVPLKNHPNKLRNHALGTLLELNVSSDLDSVERLRKTEKLFLEARHVSQLPLIMWLVGKLFSSPPAPIANFLCKNRFVPSALSNFPGPGVEMEFRGRKCLTLDGCVGGLEGVAGVVFTVVSYHEYLRVGVTVENAVMERHELVELIRSIENELNELYERARLKEIPCKTRNVSEAREAEGEEIV